MAVNDSRNPDTSRLAGQWRERGAEIVWLIMTLKTLPTGQRREKDALVGRIEALYAAAGKDTPFGLPAASLDALRRQLQFAQGLRRGR